MSLDRLEEAIRRVRDRSSLYWAFYRAEEEPDGDQEVEIRLDLPTGAAGLFEAPPGWRIHEITSSRALFMRRRQPLSEVGVEEMLIEMLRLAEASSATFHSWAHGSDLA